MKEVFFDVLRVIGAITLVGLVVYLRWKKLQRHVRDLGDGGIQTILENQKPK